MFKNIQLIDLASVLLIGNSCKKSDDPVPVDPNVTFKATINGASEVPANASTGTGTATLIFNTTTKICTVSVTYRGVTATNGHIHKGAEPICTGE